MIREAFPMHFYQIHIWNTRWTAADSQGISRSYASMPILQIMLYGPIYLRINLSLLIIFDESYDALARQYFLEKIVFYFQL